MYWHERITADPAVCHGKACIKGTRVMVSVVLDNVAAGESAKDVMRDIISNVKISRRQSPMRPTWPARR